MRKIRHVTFDMIAPEIFLGTIICQFALIGMYWLDLVTGSQVPALHTLFDLDGEGNIPAWFSSAQLLMVALTFWTHALRQPRCVRPSKGFFVLAGSVALYVSMDEAGQVHEQVTAWMGRRYVDWLPGYAGKHFWWVMIVVALGVALIQLLAPDLTNLWTQQRRYLLLALCGAGIGLLGAMGVETLGYKLLHGERTSIWYNIEVTVEEFMEMFGASLILFATLRLNRTLAGVRLRAESRAKRRIATQIRSLPVPSV